VRPLRVWKTLLGLHRSVIEEVQLERDGELVVSVRPRAGERDRCPHCRRRCPGYDQGDGRRRWRALDLGTSFCFLEAWAPRVRCKRHGVVVAAVPWARHNAGFTRSFEDQVAWLAVNTSKTAVSQLMRIAWRSVGWICQRVMIEQSAKHDLLAGLSRLGFDEISVRKGQRYLTVVVDHDTGRLVWAHPGRDRKTTEKFLDLLGKERCEQVKLVSCDDAEWITRPVSERCTNAVICLDPFHIVKTATDALDKVRREVWNEARRQGQTQLARELKGARFALWKEPREPDRAPSTQALANSETQPPPVPRVPTLPAAAPDLPSPRRARARPARSVAEMGQAIPPRTVREGRPPHHPTTRQGQSRDHKQVVKRRGRASQHPDSADHPTRVRLPLTLGRHRPRDALPRGPLPTPTRPVKPPTEPAGESKKRPEIKINRSR